MFLNVVQATKEQIEKIENKYFTNINKLLQEVKCSYDSEDNIYFITVPCFFNSSSMSFQVRNSGTTPMFFSLTKGGTRYDVLFPHGKLLYNLQSISDKAIAAWKEGSEL